MFLEILKFAIGPILGGIIGLFTNYLAIKMLFRPYTAKTIFGKRLPLTPGMIPKRQGEIAKAIGATISESLLTSEDIASSFGGDDMAKKASSVVSDYLFSGEVLNINAERADDIILSMSDVVAGKAIELAKEKEISKVLAVKIQQSVQESLPAMLSAFLPQKVMDSFSQNLTGKIDEYIEVNGKELVKSGISKELNAVVSMPLSDTLTKFSISKEDIESSVEKIYKGFVTEQLPKMFESLSISSIVEEKINDMDMRELERLILNVMKKELGAIVWLGGALGLIIGSANSLIAMFL